MRSPAIEKQVGNARLSAVPAVHFRVPFAHAVNRLCATAGRRPDAVAVELGVDSCNAVRDWLRELLGRGRQRVRAELPCMLGLTKPVRHLRPSMKKRAWALQARLGRRLADIPVDVLREELGFAGAAIIYLSPTDSIVEAIRCAVELDVPVYGVDLEDPAHAQRTETAVEDPLRAMGDLVSYVDRNAAYAARARCEEIDGRREYAMATRLKGLLAQHRHVLFTGGLAHWNRLVELLDDPAVPAAGLPQADPDAARRFTRAVVHPLHAVHHMDLFPVLAADWERRRSAAWQQASSSLASIDPARTLQGLLDAVYDDYFDAAAGGGDPLDRRFEDLENRKAFERLLANLCLLKQQHSPDFFTVLEAASAVMSPGFCRRLAQELMAFDWVAPDDHPELPLVGYVPPTVPRSQKAEYRDRRGRRSRAFYVESRPGNSPTVGVPVPWEWMPHTAGKPPERAPAEATPPEVTPPLVPPPEATPPEGGRPGGTVPDEGPPDETGSPPPGDQPGREGDDTDHGGPEETHIGDGDDDQSTHGSTEDHEREGTDDRDQGTQPETPEPRHWKVPDTQVQRHAPGGGMARTWPPYNVLHTLMSIRADQLAGGAHSRDRPRVERFEGSLLDGVDVRATMRARVNRDDGVYIRDRRQRRSRALSLGIGPCETVFILRPGPRERSHIFVHAGPLSVFEPYVAFPDELRAVQDRLGSRYVDGLSVVERVEASEAQRRAGVGLYRVHGVVAFGQMFFETLAEARWVEETGYRRNPILNDVSLQGLQRMYRDRHGIDLDPKEWPTFLVRAVIPYAANGVNIIADDDVKLDPVIYRDGQRCGIRVSRIPLSMFPADYIAKIAYQPHVSPIDEESGSYPELTERAMGESAMTFRDLLPQPLRDYGLTRARGRR